SSPAPPGGASGLSAGGARALRGGGAAAAARRGLEKGGAGQPEARLAAAEAAQLEGKLDEARAHLDKAMQLHHRDVRLYRACAALELRLEERASGADEKRVLRGKALSWLRQGADKLAPPAQEDARWYLIALLIDTGGPDELKEAGRQIAKLRASNFSRAGVEFVQGRLLVARQQWAEAAQLLE